ncbi:MAG: 30S ribosomal protein S18 [Candidatus Omnitrophica bacterium]|nr:30S ribosomal protein S18 [Candidatus Omnitrophota bacterium]
MATKTTTIPFKKRCIFCQKKLENEINYKNIELLSKYLSTKGKINSRRVSGNCAKHQRKLAKQIKLARYLSLLPYIQK